jgi:tripartite-type tricarboxylate transporter receptor subunit TctC
MNHRRDFLSFLGALALTAAASGAAAQASWPAKPITLVVS